LSLGNVSDATDIGLFSSAKLELTRA